MTEWEIQVRRPWDTKAISQAVEDVAGRQGLVISLKATLQQYPESVHWHFKRDGKSGTLEATVWPRKQRVWLSVQSRRSADWIVDAVADIAKHLEAALTLSGKE